MLVFITKIIHLTLEVQMSKPTARILISWQALSEPIMKWEIKIKGDINRMPFDNLKDSQNKRQRDMPKNVDNNEISMQSLYYWFVIYILYSNNYYSLRFQI